MEALKHIQSAPHGAPDGGAVGVSGVLEKDINLDIVLKLKEVLENNGVKVILTRNEDSGLHDGTGTIRSMKVTDMKKRLDIMTNSNADLFVTIHMNSFENKSANGLHVFYDKNHPEIKPLAEQIQASVSLITGAATHDVKEASSSLYLMKASPLPAVLVECGFLSNPEEEKKLSNEEYRSKIAWAIGKTIIEYYK